MISALLGQIIRIFYKENSPPRGSSRDLMSQGELFSLAGLALVALQRLLLGVGKTLPTNQTFEAVDLLLLHGPKPKHVFQFENSGHGQKPLGSKCCDDSKWHQICVSTQSQNDRRDERHHHDGHICRSRHLQPEEKHDLSFLEKLSLKAKGHFLPLRQSLGQKANIYISIIEQKVNRFR